MHCPLSVTIAARFLRSKNRNHFLSFISWISMIGLILGVAALITISSVLNGFEQAMTTRILGMVPQAQVFFGEPVPDWQPVAQKVQSHDSNIQAAAPLVQTRAMTSISGKIQGSILNGIVPDYQAKVSILADSMVEGSIDSLTSGSRNILLGKDIVDEHHLKVGDDIHLIIAQPSNSVVGMNPKFETFTLSGVFHVSKEIDKWMSYISMDDASDVMDIERGALGLRFRLKNVFTAPQTAGQAATLLKPEFPDIMDTNWTQTHGSLYGSIKMQKNMIGLLLFLIILVAAFNIISTLVMMVTEKKADIAILKTFGTSTRMIRHIFMAQGLMIGGLGTFLGVALGVILSYVVEPASRWLNDTFQLGLFDSYFVEALPSQIRLTDILIITSASLLVSLLATIYPAKKASQIQPARVLRYE